MASVFETVAGQRLLVGEAKIGDKAKGERVDYDIGSSPAVQVRVRILPDSDAKDYRRWEVMLTNARPFDAAVEMLIPLAIDPAPQDGERRGEAWAWRVTVRGNDRVVQGVRRGLKGDSRGGGGGG